ncbi:hypothetical protein MTP99_016138 [Tenebrio molitor]|jgi:myeloid differentiation primary response protein MyD88|uniref:myeloid differentiation primary response protein MyD88 n=1 Tax=Tenebrio molitor TaxID=7067 RepID=UPI00270AABA7|nr:hypothetical protein MTP99_016138 [Tenebrio molitor]
METSENRDVSIRVLRQKTRTLISELLNPQMYIRTEKGIHRYWLGLLGLCEIDPMYTASIEASPDPTGKILNLWCERDPQGSTIEKFVSFLDEMDRTDVIDDIADLIDEDVRIYRANPESIKPPSLEADQYVMTTDDVLRINEGRPLEMYDAFVLYDQDDIDFAIQLLETMEKDYEMKFCVKDRDLVGGGLEMDKMIKLITERCNRLIVILSDSFFKSSANSYYLSFAQAYGIESQRKIIPCLYKDCTLPANMKYLTVLDYRRNSIFNFWGRLKSSIQVASLEKSRVNRSKSDNGQVLRSALHETDNNSIRPLHQAVKFSNSVGDLNDLEESQAPLNPSTSADNIGPAPEIAKKEKKQSFLKKIRGRWKKDKRGEKRKGITKDMKRAAAVAN